MDPLFAMALAAKLRQLQLRGSSTSNRRSRCSSLSSIGGSNGDALALDVDSVSYDSTSDSETNNISRVRVVNNHNQHLNHHHHNHHSDVGNSSLDHDSDSMSPLQPSSSKTHPSLRNVPAAGNTSSSSVDAGSKKPSNHYIITADSISTGRSFLALPSSYVEVGSLKRRVQLRRPQSSSLSRATLDDSSLHSSTSSSSSIGAVSGVGTGRHAVSVSSLQRQSNYYLQHRGTEKSIIHNNSMDHSQCIPTPANCSIVSLDSYSSESSSLSHHHCSSDSLCRAQTRNIMPLVKINSAGASSSGGFASGDPRPYSSDYALSKMHVAFSLDSDSGSSLSGYSYSNMSSRSSSPDWPESDVTQNVWNTDDAMNSIPIHSEHSTLHPSNRTFDHHDTGGDGASLNRGGVQVHSYTEPNQSRLLNPLLKHASDVTGNHDQNTALDLCTTTKHTFKLTRSNFRDSAGDWSNLKKNAHWQSSEEIEEEDDGIFFSSSSAIARRQLDRLDKHHDPQYHQNEYHQDLHHHRNRYLSSSPSFGADMVFV